MRNEECKDWDTSEPSKDWVYYCGVVFRVLFFPLWVLWWIWREYG